KYGYCACELGDDLSSVSEFPIMAGAAGRGGADPPSVALRLPHANLTRYEGLYFTSAHSIDITG
ncbi:7658_t:CDS:1, partial [Acaulospora colombiana]